MSLHHLKMHFNAVECNGWPKIRIIIDNDVYEELTLDQPSQFVTIPLNFINGKHLLEIELYGKSDRNVVFVDGKIIQDQLVELVDIYVDDIKLGDMFKYRDAVFTHQHGSIPNGYTWGANGSFTWPFEMPIISWLVKVKQQIEDDNVSLYIPSKHNVNELYSALDKFENLINECPI